MPRSQSPPRAPRQRSRSPRRDRVASSRDDRHREDRRSHGSDRDQDRGGRDSSYRDRDKPSARNDDRPRSRSPPPARHHPRRPKELSFYKRGGPSGPVEKDPLEIETEKERLQRREKGEVPARFGGTREQGVRNTMTMNPNLPVGGVSTSVGSLGRKMDPLDRMSSKGGGGGVGDRNGDKLRDERVAAMGKAQPVGPAGAGAGQLRFIEVIANSRMGGKVRVKCLPTDTVGDLKRLIAAQTGTTAAKIQLKKWYTPFKDHITLQDYEIHDGMSLEMY